MLYFCSFNKEDDPINYCLYKTNQAQGVKERVLELDEKPWQHIQELYKVIVENKSCL